MKSKALFGPKLMIGFGAVTILSGVYLVLEENWITGISGALVGALLIYINLQKPKTSQRASDQEEAG